MDGGLARWRSDEHPKGIAYASELVMLRNVSAPGPTADGTRLKTGLNLQRIG